MKVDTGINLDLHAIPDAVRTIEAQGYDGVRTAEMNHDPFFPLLLAAEHSEKLEIASSIAVAFARSPMNLANIGHYVFAHSVNIPADRMQEVKELLHESMKTGKLKEFMAISHYTPGYELDANGIGIKEFYDNAYALLGESR